MKRRTRPLTRPQVARELGVSLTMVRKLQEAGRLHTERDGAGRHIFDPLEVEGLKRARSQGRREAFDPTDLGRSSRETGRESIQREVREALDTFERDRASREAERERERAARQAESEDLEATLELIELEAELEALPRRERLRALEALDLDF